MNSIRSGLLASLTILIAMAAPASVQAQNSGRVGAVNPDARGTPPGAESRVLTIGGNVVYKEKSRRRHRGPRRSFSPTPRH